MQGGEPIKKHREALKEGVPTVVVATPGRLKALCDDDTLDLGQVQHFVIDECDEMLGQLGEPPARSFNDRAAPLTINADPHPDVG